jgi:hypothetical protein
MVRLSFQILSDVPVSQAQGKQTMTNYKHFVDVLNFSAIMPSKESASMMQNHQARRQK